MFNVNQRLGEIVTKFPRAADIFKEYNVDFCCGGNRQLKIALEEQGIDEAEILERLNSAYEFSVNMKENTTDWTSLSTSDLIDHIVSTHHAYLYEELPAISELTAKILRAHGSRHAELSKVHRMFNSLKMELEEHLIKEEEVLFPMLKKCEKAPSDELVAEIRRTIQETEDEHTGAGDILKELRNITNNYEVPEDGCRTYKITFERIQELESDLFQHIHLENNILFERF